MTLLNRYLLCLYILLVIILTTPFGTSLSYAESFIFKWTANHANDNVDLYSLYWTRVSLDYSIIDGVNGGKVVVPSESPSLINYPPDIVNLVYPQLVDFVEWDIPAVSPDEIVCFVVTATDNEGFESDYSNQLCYGPVVADFIVNEDNYTSFAPSGWVDSNAIVNVYLGDYYDNGIFQIKGVADDFGAWTATEGVDLSVLPEGTICFYAVLNRGTIEAPIYIYSGVVCGAKDTATSKLTAGTGAAGISENSATIMWSTNEATTTVLEYRTADQSLPDEEKIFGHRSDTNELIDHSMAISGLRPFTTFYYRVKATDAAGNVLISREKTFKTLFNEDTEAPQVTTPVVEKVESATSAVISWNVNELSDSVLEYRKEGEIYGPLFKPDSGQGYRTMVLDNLEPASSYYCRVQATDKNGNGPIFSAEIIFSTPAAQIVDMDPPVIDEATIDVTVEDRSATITWITDEVSNSKVEYWTEGSDVQSVSVNTYAKTHLVILVALDQLTTYDFLLVNTDDAVDPNTAYSTVKSFTTLETPDITDPVFDEPPTINVTDTSATIAWLSNEETTGSVQYGEAPSSWDNYTNNQDDIVLQTVHSVTLTGLSQDTLYYYQVGMVDGSNNGPTVSNQYSFRTEITPDERAPQFDMWPTVIGKTDSSAVIRWSTDETSTSLVSYGTEASDTWGTYPFTLNDGNLAETHEIKLTNLTPATEYYLMVGSTDAVGNGPTLSLVLTFTTDAAVDAERPRITVPPTVTGITNDSATIYWETDEPANGVVHYGYRKSKWDTYPFEVINSQVGTGHTVVLNNLEGNTRFYFRVGSTDAAGNGPNTSPRETNNPFSEEVFMTLVAPDTDAPSITSDPEVTAVDNDSATITWETDEPSNSNVKYNKGQAKKSALTLSVSESELVTDQSSKWTDLTLSVSKGDMTTEHNVTLTGLSPSTTYNFMVGSQDAKGNGPSVNNNVTNPWPVKSFQTTSTNDTIAPLITDITMTFATDTTALITWNTDEPANSMARYGTVSSSTWEDYAYEENDAEMKTEHSTTITNLQPGTAYFFRIGSTDLRGNGPTHNSLPGSNPSAEGGFTTKVFPDTEAPQIVPNSVSIEVNVAARTALVTWDTPDEPGNSQVQYDVVSRDWGGYAFAENDAGMVYNHSVILTNLKVNTIYYFRVSSVDASGNNYNASFGDDNPSKEYNFYLEQTASESGSASEESKVEEAVGEIATCFIQSTVDYISLYRIIIGVVGVLVGIFGLVLVRVSKIHYNINQD